MRRLLFLAVGLIAASLAAVLTASAASDPKPRQVISNPFHEYSGYPGLKLGYGNVLAQCQTYDNASNANPYAPFVTNVNVIVGDNINVGVGVNQGCRTPQNETVIAVNPTNPNNLVAGANDYRDCCVPSGGTDRNDATGYVYVSMNGGLTWSNIKLPGLGIVGDPSGVFGKVTSVGDPAIAFGKNNTVYYANIAFNRVDDKDAIVTSVSHDGGLTWDNPALVAFSGGATFFNDKVWVGADPNSGKAYVSWTRFKDNPQFGYVESPIVVSRTSDYGQDVVRLGRRQRPVQVQPGLDADRRQRRHRLHLVRGRERVRRLCRLQRRRQVHRRRQVVHADGRLAQQRRELSRRPGAGAAGADWAEVPDQLVSGADRRSCHRQALDDVGRQPQRHRLDDELAGVRAVVDGRCRLDDAESGGRRRRRTRSTRGSGRTPAR